MSTLNISQMLFTVDEQLMQKSNIGNGISGQMPAYVNQARLSTYYQDNPFGTLLFSTKFCLDPMGGNVNDANGSGSRPGSRANQPLKNTCTNTIKPAVIPTQTVSGITYAGYLDISN